jgi:hypothetical protein
MLLPKIFLIFVVTATVLHGGLQVTLLLWTPDPDTLYVYFLIAGLWGMGDAVIQTQINGMSTVIHVQ